MKSLSYLFVIMLFILNSKSSLKIGNRMKLSIDQNQNLLKFPPYLIEVNAKNGRKFLNAEFVLKNHEFVDDQLVPQILPLFISVVTEENSNFVESKCFSLWMIFQDITCLRSLIKILIEQKINPYNKLFNYNYL